MNSIKMDLQKFDSTLKSALDKIEVPFDPGTWAALESRLDTLPEPDAIDKQIRPALERIETAYDGGSWSMLANRMDSIARVRRLRLTKLAEAAIFLLLLLNLSGFLGIIESVTNPVPAKKEASEPIAKTQNLKSKKQNPVKIIPSQTGNPEDQSLAQQLVSLVHGLAASLSSDAENEDKNTAANIPQSTSPQASVLDPSNFYQQSGVVKFPVGPTLPASAIQPVLFASSNIIIPGIEYSNTLKSSRLYAASFGTFERNNLRDGTHTDKKNGFGGGVAIGFRKGNWGFEAGLSYSEKNYQPKRENVEYQNDPFNGISFYHIDRVDADVFSVPVKATRRMVKVGKTSAHAVAGVTANFATSKNYASKTVHYPPPIPQPNPNPNQNPSSALPNGKGLLENGGLPHNAYASADLGLRVEHVLGKRYTAFVEPIFRQSIGGGGLGPNSGRLNTFSLNAGVMASL